MICSHHEKKCTRCLKEKPINSFQKRKASRDGLTASCKTCLSAYEKSRAKLPHRVRARKLYASTDKGKAAGLKARKKWSQRNPIKKLASTIVGNAVRDGKILKPSVCEDCGSKPKRLHGHHDDYAFPLEVRWLCPRCHNNWHKENGEGLNAS